MLCHQTRNNILLETKRRKCNPIRNSFVDCSDKVFSLDSNISIERSALAVPSLENGNDFADNSVNNLESKSIQSGALNLNLLSCQSIRNIIVKKTIGTNIKQTIINNSISPKNN